MRSTRLWLVIAGLLSFVALAVAQTNSSQKHKGVFITRLYTGPDGQTHAEEIEAKFIPGNGNDIFKMMMKPELSCIAHRPVESAIGTPRRAANTSLR